MYRLVNENSATQVNTFVNQLKKFKNKGILVIVVHHLNKSEIDSDDPFKNLAGHSNFYRAIDGGILLLPKKDSNSINPTYMTMKFSARSFAPIPDKDIVFYKKEHMLQEEYEAKYSQKEQLFDISQEDKLKTFIKANLPADQSDALERSELISMMAECTEISYSDSTIERRKLAEWEEKGYLKSIGNRPKKYYQGKNL